MEVEKEYHKSRRMFVIINGGLIIAEANISEAHEGWFERENWEDMDEKVRGYVKTDESYLRFYVGNFQITDSAEEEFFPYLKELVERLGLKKSMEIWGGAIPGDVGEIWEPIKKFGRIGHYFT